MKASEQVENEREQEAEDDTGSEREVDGHVRPTPGEIAGQMAEGDAEEPEEVDDSSSENEQQAEHDEQARKSGHLLQITPDGGLEADRFR